MTVQSDSPGEFIPTLLAMILVSQNSHRFCVCEDMEHHSRTVDLLGVALCSLPASRLELQSDVRRPLREADRKRKVAAPTAI
eukprot:1874616-Amphidinium_carterae.1